jgi:hypothetical protein
MTRRVRTPEGAERFDLPIGAPIRARPDLPGLAGPARLLVGEGTPVGQVLTATSDRRVIERWLGGGMTGRSLAEAVLEEQVPPGVDKRAAARALVAVAKVGPPRDDWRAVTRWALEDPAGAAALAEAVGGSRELAGPGRHLVAWAAKHRSGSIPPSDVERLVRALRGRPRGEAEDVARELLNGDVPWQAGLEAVAGGFGAADIQRAATAAAIRGRPPEREADVAAALALIGQVPASRRSDISVGSLAHLMEAGVDRLDDELRDGLALPGTDLRPAEMRAFSRARRAGLVPAGAERAFGRAFHLAIVNWGDKWSSPDSWPTEPPRALPVFTGDPGMWRADPRDLERLAGSLHWHGAVTDDEGRVLPSAARTAVMLRALAEDWDPEVARVMGRMPPEVQALAVRRDLSRDAFRRLGTPEGVATLADLAADAPTGDEWFGLVTALEAGVRPEDWRAAREELRRRLPGRPGILAHEDQAATAVAAALAGDPPRREAYLRMLELRADDRSPLSPAARDRLVAAAVTAWPPASVERFLAVSDRWGTSDVRTAVAAMLGPRLAEAPEGIEDRVAALRPGPDSPLLHPAIAGHPDVLERWLDAPEGWSDEERSWYARVGNRRAALYRRHREAGMDHARAARATLGLPVDGFADDVGPADDAGAEAAQSASRALLEARFRLTTRWLTAEVGQEGGISEELHASAVAAKKEVADAIAADLGWDRLRFDRLWRPREGSVPDPSPAASADLIADVLASAGPDRTIISFAADPEHDDRPEAWIEALQHGLFWTAPGGRVGFGFAGGRVVPVPDPPKAMRGLDEARRALGQYRASVLVASWAATANSSPGAQVIQDGAQRLFGLGRVADWDLTDDARAALDQARREHLGPDLDVALAGMWHRTQRALAGVDRVRLWRGWQWNGGHPAPPWAAGALGDPAKEAHTADVVMRPLNSTAAFRPVAEGFDGAPNGVVTELDVPVERILAMPGTGFGCLEEAEVVVIGGTYRGGRVRAAG